METLYTTLVVSSTIPPRPAFRILMDGLLNVTQKSSLRDNVGLWESPDRDLIKLALTITVAFTCLLLVWALFFILFQTERRQDVVLFILNMCYITCLFFTTLLFNTAVYLSPSHESCLAVIGLSHMFVLVTLAMCLLAALRRYRQALRQEREGVEAHHPHHQSPRELMASVLLYITTGFLLPLVNLLFLIARLQNKMADKRLMCWIEPDTAQWLVIPFLVYVCGGNLPLAVLTYGSYDRFSVPDRCFIYTCLLLNVLLGSMMLVVQTDLLWPSVVNGFVIFFLLLVHNIIVWLHITDNIITSCPCGTFMYQYSAEAAQRETNDRRGRGQASITMVITAQTTPTTPGAGSALTAVGVDRGQAGRTTGSLFNFPGSMSPSQSGTGRTPPEAGQSSNLKIVSISVDDALGAVDDDLYQAAMGTSTDSPEVLSKWATQQAATLSRHQSWSTIDQASKGYESGLQSTGEKISAIEQASGLSSQQSAIDHASGLSSQQSASEQSTRLSSGLSSQQSAIKQATTLSQSSHLLVSTKRQASRLSSHQSATGQTRRQSSQQEEQWTE